MTETHRRDERLFGLLLNSGLRIGEALGLKAADVRRVGTGSVKFLTNRLILLYY